MNASEPLEVVVVGVAAMDLVARVDALPGPDELVVASSHAMYPGGAGANVAVGLSRLGRRTGFWGVLGTGPDARVLADAFAAGQVDDTACPGDELPQVRCLITIDGRGERTIVVLQGAGKIERPDGLNLPYVCQGRAVVLTDYTAEIGLAVLQAAFSAGTLAFYNPGGAVVSQGLELLEPLLPLTDVLLLSRTEAGKLLPGLGYQAAARWFLNAGAGVVIITLGAEGAFIARPAAHSLVPALAGLPVVDSTGAGDAFTAGLVCAFLEGKSWEEAVRFANIVAALSTGRVGARSGLPLRAAVEPYLAPGGRS